MSGFLEHMAAHLIPNVLVCGLIGLAWWLGGERAAEIVLGVVVALSWIALALAWRSMR